MAFLFLSAAAVLILDQWTKMWAESRVQNRVIDFGLVAIRHVAAERKTLDPRILAVVLAISFGCAVALIESGQWFRQPAALTALDLHSAERRATSSISLDEITLWISLI